MTPNKAKSLQLAHLPSGAPVAHHRCHDFAAARLEARHGDALAKSHRRH